ncbi:R3H domain-containing protein 4 [Frankliniella fusca]|uniref:R3H domain-containing protein 4 n=1 Tax=Frankliniella fusca TaxID=407009 RepID=A0AAE1HFX1_9NEOP|nr:R3H domain-containing protein 4 [Frankliniella fusca]
MGLISKEDRVKGLFNASSAESLHIPSDPPSEDELPPPPPAVLNHHHNHHPPGPKPRVRPIPTAFFHLRKCLGKKKSRRYHDVNSLMTLVEEEEFGEVSINDLAPCHDTLFAQLLNDRSSMAKWNEFAESSDEAQQRFLNQFCEKGQIKRKKGTNGETLSGEDAFQNIDVSLRTVLRKSKVPLGLVSYMEENLTAFFLEHPLEIFISENLTSFERLLLHAISQYNQLFSHSFDAADDSNGRYVKVVNPHQDFRLPTLSLGDFLSVRK